MTDNQVVRIEDLRNAIDFDKLREKYLWFLYDYKNQLVKGLSSEEGQKDLAGNSSKLLEELNDKLKCLNLILDNYEKGNYELFEKSFGLYMRYQIKSLLTSVNFSTLYDSEEVKKVVPTLFGFNISFDGVYSEEGLRNFLCETIGMNFVPADTLITKVNEREEAIHSFHSSNDKDEASKINAQIDKAVTDIYSLSSQTMLRVTPTLMQDEPGPLHINYGPPDVSASLNFDEADDFVIATLKESSPIINVPSSTNRRVRS